MSHDHPEDWDEHQAWEREWWGDCLNTFTEEVKQRTYASFMGLHAQVFGGCYPVYDLRGKNVIDIGGGPVSMLLKTTNRGPRCFVADPCIYPDWTTERYAHGGIQVTRTAGEDLEKAFDRDYFDEAWIYNVLQHTQEPEKIVKAALEVSPVVRMFEWTQTPITPGHPHSMTKKQLEEWLGSTGGEVYLDASKGDSCFGWAFYGVFERP
jgi:hypothetical protein